ncbi:MAG: hypothetical protein ONB17_08195 [candidate division KSB1 bacterium]|nr:hypothetical protein [candidate division KSB1 bacterium]MDZ7295275.1 hypothetical protein [candidate division KSB1 bacterium]MDZ7393695.1 hypothetical protein [candidate division KSB1 bacterium]MDZ7412488.1 hypothetical protein [candidate division KSB1 bacterium]
MSAERGPHDTIRTIISQRGLRYAGDSPVENVLLPASPEQASRQEYLRYLKRYSFRILLRDVIKCRSSFRAQDLLHYCSPRKVQRYLDYLQRAGIVEPVGTDTFRLRNAAVYSFGDTLEWYVAQVFAEAFAAAVAWDVKVYDLPAGGDFDVIAMLGDLLVYVETKSSPPKNIHQPAVAAFFARLEALAPDVGIFLVDTHLRLADKINKMVRYELKQRVGDRDTVGLVQLRRGVYAASPGLFVINSKPDLTLNLRLCLRHFWAHRARRRLFGYDEHTARE